MLNKNIVRCPQALIALLLIIITMTGCGAVHSDAVQGLVKHQVNGLDKVDVSLRDLEKTVESAIQDLKRSNRLYVKNLEIWEKEIKRAKIVSSAPDNLSDPDIRRSVFTQIAQLEIDRDSAYGNMRRDFNVQADNLLKAYKKMLTAVGGVKTELNAIKVKEDAIKE